MPPLLRRFLSCLLPIVGLGVSVPARAADLPFLPPTTPSYSDRFEGGGGGGFRVARVPVRPVPLRYDIYGYPVLGAVPSPLAMGNGCPPALQPDYDASGNFAGYSPIPLCR